MSLQSLTTRHTETHTSTQTHTLKNEQELKKQREVFSHATRKQNSKSELEVEATDNLEGICLKVYLF